MYKREDLFWRIIFVVVGVAFGLGLLAPLAIWLEKIAGSSDFWASTIHEITSNSFREYLEGMILLLIIQVVDENKRRNGKKNWYFGLVENWDSSALITLAVAVVAPLFLNTFALVSMAALLYHLYFSENTIKEKSPKEESYD